MSRAKDVYETLCVVAEPLDEDRRHALAGILKGLFEGHDVEAGIGAFRWLRDGGYMPKHRPQRERKR